MGFGLSAHSLANPSGVAYEMTMVSPSDAATQIDKLTRAKQ
jgi:hypothetical protein